MERQTRRRAAYRSKSTMTALASRRIRSRPPPQPVRSRLSATANMVMVDLGIPPGFELLSEDLRFIPREQRCEKERAAGEVQPDPDSGDSLFRFDRAAKRCCQAARSGCGRSIRSGHTASLHVFTSTTIRQSMRRPVPYGWKYEKNSLTGAATGSAGDLVAGLDSNRVFSGAYSKRRIAHTRA